MDEGNAANRAFVGYYKKQLPDDVDGALPDFEIGEAMCTCDDRPLYAIEQRESGERYLLQVFSPALFADEEANQRFVRGLLAMRELDHPGILKLVDCRILNGWYYLIHEYFEGVTLMERHQQAELDPQSLVLLIAAACDPLDYCHRAGLRHGALSVTSILVGTGEEPVEADAGDGDTAKDEGDESIDEADGELSQRKRPLVKVVNTGVSDLLYPTDAQFIQNLGRGQSEARPYVAPERLIDDRVSDLRADIYSLGAMVYYVLVGSPPGGFAVLPSTRADIEKRVDVVTMKAMHGDPEKRHASADAFSADLKRLGAGNKNDTLAFAPKAKVRPSGNLDSAGAHRALVAMMVFSLIAAVLSAGYYFGKDFVMKIVDERSRALELPTGEKIAELIPVMDVGKREATIAVATHLLRSAARNGSGGTGSASADAVSHGLGIILEGGDQELALQLGMEVLETADPNSPDFKRINQMVKELEYRIGGKTKALDEAKRAREAGDIRAERTALLRAKNFLPEDPELDERIREVNGGSREEIEGNLAEMEAKLPDSEKLRYSLEEEEGSFSLDLSNNPSLVDVSALKGLPLTELNLSNTGVKDISPIKGMPLDALHLDGTGVEDLKAVEGMPLSTITAEDTPVENVLFLKEMLSVVNYRFGKGNRERKSRVERPKPGKRYVNSIGMRMQPMRGQRRRMLSIWETRVADFRKFVEATGYKVDPGMFMIDRHEWKEFALSWERPGFEQGKNHPVVGVSVGDAVAYCEWLTEKERAEGLLKDDDIYRLPTSEEWDYAAGLHHATSAPFAWGTNWPPNYDSSNLPGQEVFAYVTEENTLALIPGPKPIVLLDFKDDYPYTSPAGFFLTDGRFRDLGGNVREWCSDFRETEKATFQVVRGAGWLLVGATEKPYKLFQLSHQGEEIPGSRYANIGFRVMLELAELQPFEESVAEAQQVPAVQVPGG